MGVILWVVLGWVVTVCLMPIVILVSGATGAHGEKGLKVTRSILYGFAGWMVALVSVSIVACT